MKNTVLFDPGIGNLVVNFNEFVNNVYSQLMSFKGIPQKRLRFRQYTAKIENYMKNNIAFYLGCLLWAYYINTENKKAPKEITGNFFYNLTDEEKENYDYLIQVNFMENYFDSFERDYLYYTGKKFEIPELWKNILKTYSEFLELNKGFVNTKTTADIKLPEILEKAEFKFDINKMIEKAIKEENLEILLNIEKLPF